MHLRRSSSDSKASTNVPNTTNISTTTSNNSNSGRVSIYSMRERVIQNKMTQFMTKLAPDTETEVTSRLHQEIPAVRLDGHLIYCLYTTLQNLMHLSATYIYLFHTVFWLGSTTYRGETIEYSRTLEKNSFEETQMIGMADQQYSNIGTSINTQRINKFVYLTLIGVSSFELICAFLWTIKKKLPHLVPRHSKLKSRLAALLIVSIFFVYFFFIGWIFHHTFVTRQLTYRFGSFVVVHFIILILLDKPNLFRRHSNENKTSRKRRNSTSSSSTSSLGRNSYRKSTKIIEPSGTTTPKIWSRWSSVTEEKIPVHHCSTFYGHCREEADELRSIVIRRILLCFYRSLTSIIFYDIVPLRSRNEIENERSFLLFVATFSLGTFVTQSSFLFPVKLQTTLHRIATHLGQWRLQSFIRTENVPEWSPDSNSYTRGSVVKFSSNSKESFLAVQHLSNAGHPQSRFHSFLYRFFGDLTYVLTRQFLLCVPLILLNLFWIIRGKFWNEIIVGSLMTFFNCYPIYKIVRDRILIDFVEENESFQTLNLSKEKK